MTLVDRCSKLMISDYPNGTLDIGGNFQENLLDAVLRWCGRVLGGSGVQSGHTTTGTPLTSCWTAIVFVGAGRRQRGAVSLLRWNFASGVGEIVFGNRVSAILTFGNRVSVTFGNRVSFSAIGFSPSSPTGTFSGIGTTRSPSASTPKRATRGRHGKWNRTEAVGNRRRFK